MKKQLMLLTALLVMTVPIATFTVGMRPTETTQEFVPSKEGWWQVQEGILARWCSEQYPCPDTPGMLKNTHRLHVWCKDSDCGNILAYANIYDGKIIIANESAQGIADRGDQLILSFTTNASGSAVRLVRFQATGGTANLYPLILRTNADHGENL